MSTTWSISLWRKTSAAWKWPKSCAVLAPQGVVCVKDGVWKKTVKPRPQDIDEWTHYLHGPNNNAVAQDAEVGSPRHLQWLAEPRHARSHEHLATVSVVVSAQGRLFSIVDEGPTLAVVLPARWRLVACDAFNGLELWRRPIGPWEPHMNWFARGRAAWPDDWWPWATGFM